MILAHFHFFVIVFVACLQYSTSEEDPFDITALQVLVEGSCLAGNWEVLAVARGSRGNWEVLTALGWLQHSFSRSPEFCIVDNIITKFVGRPSPTPSRYVLFLFTCFSPFFMT